MIKGNRQKGKWRIIHRGKWWSIVNADSVTSAPEGYIMEYKATEKLAKDRVKKINE